MPATIAASQTQSMLVSNVLSYPLPTATSGRTTTAGSSMTLFTPEGAAPALGFAYDELVEVAVISLSPGITSQAVTISDHDGANARTYRVGVQSSVFVNRTWKRGIRLISTNNDEVTATYAFLGRRQRRARL